MMNRRDFCKLSLASSIVSVGYAKNVFAQTSIETQLHTNSFVHSELSGKRFDLTVAEKVLNVTGKRTTATLINGSLPAPTLRMTEGDTITINVHNQLDVDTSIHWHGFILPYQMDGVPGISFEGIKPKQSFQYQFTLNQSGTYWYHSHSGFQEQMGMYGAIIVEPKEGYGIHADREHVIVLSDWTDLNPHTILRRLKQNSHFDNYHQPTVTQFYHDIQRMGLKQAWQKRAMWQQMRMSPTDFADLSGIATYRYLMNGTTSEGRWTGLFNRGETVRLRIINASSQSMFDLRIPDLPMTVIGSDGGLVEPVTVDELRIAVGETYDVLIHPCEDVYTIFAQSMDRSGYCVGTLAVAEGLTAPIPEMDAVAWLTMADMMGTMGPARAKHAHTEFGSSVDYRVDSPRTNLDDPGVNLRHGKRRVLTYADLYSIGSVVHEQLEPTRTLELHLTGNMERYQWGIDGLSYHESKPIHLTPNERVRFVLVNDTMMTHPMHLHGMWSDLRKPDGTFQVRKHTIMVQPAQQISYDVTAIAGRWAWHCHLLYHMESGMMREVVVE